MRDLIDTLFTLDLEQRLLQSSIEDRRWATMVLESILADERGENTTQQRTRAAYLLKLTCLRGSVSRLKAVAVKETEPSELRGQCLASLERFAFAFPELQEDLIEFLNKIDLREDLLGPLVKLASSLPSPEALKLLEGLALNIHLCPEIRRLALEALLSWPSEEAALSLNHISGRLNPGDAVARLASQYAVDKRRELLILSAIKHIEELKPAGEVLLGALLENKAYSAILKLQLSGLIPSALLEKLKFLQPSQNSSKSERSIIHKICANISNSK